MFINLSNLLMRSKIPLVFFFLFSLIYLFTYIIIPFHDHDSVLYALRGKIIMEGIPSGSLPFDHKPIGLHVIYGIFGEFIKYGHGQSLIISLFFNSFFVYITYTLLKHFLEINKNKTKHLLIAVISFLIIFQAPFVGLSGNSETLANLFILLSLSFLIKSKENYTFLLVFFSGIFAVLAISINYLSGIILSLPSLYLLFTTSNDRKLSVFSIYLFSVSLGALLFLSLLYFLEISDQYFEDLIAFLKAYGERTLEERLKALLYFSRWILIFLPIIFSVLFLLPKQSKDKPYNLTTLLLLWVVSAFIVTLLSGNDFHHYFSFVIAPLIILSALIVFKSSLKEIFFIFFIPIFYCMSYMPVEIYDNLKKYKALEKTYKDIDSIFSVVKHKDILSIRIGHVPLYLSDMKISQKYLFPNLAAYFEGDNEDQYWKEEISDYEFILIPKKTCELEQLPLTCDSLKKNYTKILESSYLEEYKIIQSFYLYKK